uniref:Uncharacterized protein n=1 Tax=Caenorhabditis japonica TaxID=281687 RepID=A0A8R1EB70_CAEJA
MRAHLSARLRLARPSDLLPNWSTQQSRLTPVVSASHYTLSSLTVDHHRDHGIRAIMPDHCLRLHCRQSLCRYVTQNVPEGHDTPIHQSCYKRRTIEPFGSGLRNHTFICLLYLFWLMTLIAFMLDQ